MEEVPVAEEHTAKHFLPHFPVIREDRVTTKTRIVFDPSKTSPRVPCLNDLLDKGPSLIPLLTTILIKFRLYAVGITADIEKAFLQIMLAENDRDYTRFLWLRDINGDVVDNNIVQMRFLRVLFGPSPSPFLLNATIRYHLGGYDKSDEIVQKILNAFYSDNLVTGTESVGEGKQLHDHTKVVFDAAGMNMRSWVSNEVELQNHFGSGLVAAAMVLGLKWITGNDSLKIHVDKVLSAVDTLGVLTKRVACSLAARLFDPLAFLEPFTVRAKIMLQELWSMKVGWDDPIPAAQAGAWNEWLREIQNITKYAVPRRYVPCKSEEVAVRELHVFCDSSEKAYGAVCYLRVVTTDGTVYVQHVLARSKVAPLKKLTIPRLEFLAALLGCAVLKHVVSALGVPISSTVFWSDSQISLFWIAGKGSPDRFVRNKLIKYQEDLANGTWRYCPSKMNPADAITRGLTMDELTLTRWTDGPSWLRREEDWPETLTLDVVDAPDPAVVQLAPVVPADEPVVDMKRFCSYTKLVTATALAVRFVQNYCCKDRSGRNLGDVTISELRNALSVLVRIAQRECYQSEVTWLEGGKTSSPPSLVRQLKLFLDEKGILRCKGRIENALLPNRVKFPILLPKKHQLTKLIIWKCHKEVLHGLVRETLAQVRQRFWIPQGRRVVKSNIRGCVTCLKAEGQPYQGCEPPPLPESRVTEGIPFQFCGVDFAGPLLVRKDPTMQLDDEMEDTKKVYVSLVTCAVTRAVHLEIADDLSTAAFLRTFRRFISRRGLPDKMISDNATNFHGAAEELTALSKKILESAQCQRFFMNKGIRWQFIVSRAAWWGGFYERMIGLMKRSLKRTIGKNLLWLHELSTVIVEVEAVLNSRPITFTYSDIEEGSPLTPAHFLCSKRLLDLPDCSDNELDDPEYTPDSNQENLVKYLDARNRQLKAFWRVWRREYLVNLREYDQVKRKKSNNPSSPKIGEIVLIGDQTPRSRWKLAKIVKLISGTDGAVRAAEVKTSNGNVLQRALQHLYPLEIGGCDEDADIDSVEVPSVDVLDDDQGAHNERPRRQAAVEANRRLRSMSL